MGIDEKAILDGSMALTPISITPDDLMLIARSMTTEATNRAQAKQKIYHKLTTSIVLVYDPEITLMNQKAQTTRELPGTGMSDAFEKDLLEKVRQDELVQ